MYDIVSMFHGCLLINKDEWVYEGHKRLTYDQLRVNFSRLICLILNQGPQQKDSLEAYKTLCIDLRASNSANIPLFSPEKVLEINNSNDFRQFFEIVGQHLNWDEPSILTEIINECGLKKIGQKFNEYKKEMATFRTIEIVSSDKSDPPPGFEKLSVVIDKPYVILTLDKYEDIKSFIFKNLDVHRYVTSGYIRVLLDPLHLEWHVTTQAIPHMIKMAHEEQEVFKSKSFIFMEIGKEVIIDANTEQSSVSLHAQIVIKIYALTL